MNKYEQFSRCKELLQDSVELSVSLEKYCKDKRTSTTLNELQGNLDAMIWLISELGGDEDYTWEVNEEEDQD